MPKKKPPPKKAITVRLSKSQYDAVVLAAREASLSGGFPVTITGYATQATVEHARLRRIEQALKEGSLDAKQNGDSADPESVYAAQILEESAK